MTINYRPGWVVSALFVAAVVAGPASAQSLRWPSNYPPSYYPDAEPVYARVTITNQTNITIRFRARWPNEAAQRKVLSPGESVTLETTFAPLTPNPELRVSYRPGRRARHREVMHLPSGHVDPNTYNPGRVYDFYRQWSNRRPLVTLTAR